MVLLGGRADPGRGVQARREFPSAERASHAVSLGKRCRFGGRVVVDCGRQRNASTIRDQELKHKEPEPMKSFWRKPMGRPMRIVSPLAVGCAGLLLSMAVGCGGSQTSSPPGPSASKPSASKGPATEQAQPAPQTPSGATPSAAGEQKPTASKSKGAGESNSAAAAGGTGTLRGKVVYEGEYKPLPPLVKAGAKNVKDAAVCAAHDVPDESLIVNTQAGNGVANVFVYLSRAPKGVEVPAPPGEPLELDQKGCRFVPHAMVVRVGQTVLIKSSDNIQHNVHTFPAFNAPFNQICQPLEQKGIPLVYERPEREPVQVKCDIHPWMKALHLPLDHPFAAVTGEDGTFTIENLPAGTHKFRVWHERVGFVEKSLEVNIEPDKATEVTVTIKADQIAAIPPEIRTVRLQRP
ncbi:MAG: hypothetical protein D6725_07170 [Planctomycetota bacterium]|nr:MAG: hypothetical protein D6725_07170 [Planctomycetota bacterium]